MAGLILIVFLSILPRNSAVPIVFAEPISEETRQLLEKSLSITEIDREIARIADLRRQTLERMENTLSQLDRLEQALIAQREKADEVLRAYYMGRKDFIFGVLLSSRSLKDLFYAWELIEILLQSDRRTLDEYALAYDRLQEGYRSLERDQAELQQVEDSLRAQRERLVALQEEVDRTLAQSNDEARLRRMMEELNEYWKTAGLLEVKRVLSALAEAMHDLPEWILEQPGMVTTSGLSAKLTVTDTALNEYLQSRNQEVFRYFSIRFEQNRMVASGDNGDMQIEIGGHYTIQEEPVNALQFHVDSLFFNGLELPDTTRADLEREFDLGFYPELLVAFVKVQKVSIAPGLLTVELKFG
jgi:hypothetical protein